TLSTILNTRITARLVAKNNNTLFTLHTSIGLLLCTIWAGWRFSILTRWRIVRKDVACISIRYNNATLKELNMQLLLLSSSRAQNSDYLAPYMNWITAHLTGITELLFIPYAG